MKRLQNQGHCLYFDNFFTSFNLLEILNQKLINAAGTARTNRFRNPNFLTDKELMKSGRGSSQELVSNDHQIVIVKWLDNRSVCLASNYVGEGNIQKVRRYDKKKKTYDDINQPEVVKDYNFGMGGVDLLDQYLSYYRIFIKSNKWTLRMAFHFVQMACVCAFMEHKKDSNMTGESPMTLLTFQESLANALIDIDIVKKEDARLYQVWKIYHHSLKEQL